MARRRETDKSKPKKLNTEKRVLSKKVQPPGRDTCNAKLASRDGYCQMPGLKPFSRCKVHDTRNNSYDIFAKSVGLGQAVKLQAFIEDTTSMDNELASAKILFTHNLEEWSNMTYVIDAYMQSIPVRPDLDAEPPEIETYSRAVELHTYMLDMAREREGMAYERSVKILKTMTDAIAKNKKLKEGNRFTMDVRQIREILRIQLEVMAKNCKGCPSIKSITKEMRERIKDVQVDPQLSKANRKAMGAKAYGEELEKVNAIADNADALFS
jgi:hypothetical protein